VRTSDAPTRHEEARERTGILIVDTVIGADLTGGAQTFLLTFCIELIRQGMAPTVVVSPEADPDVANRLTALGTSVCRYSPDQSSPPEEQAHAFAKWVDSKEPTACIISVSSWLAWLAVPQISSEVQTIGIAHTDMDWYYQPLAHYAPILDGAVGVSRRVYDTLIHKCRFEPDRAFYIPYGIAPDNRAAVRPFRPDSAPLRVGYVGRLVQPQKRVHDLLPLSLALVARSTPFELHIIGDGPERQALETGFRQNGLLPTVCFWGWLEGSAIQERLASLDAIVMMSDFEGLPLSLLEAMRSGVVPVVTDIASGHGELVNDCQNGFLVRIGDTDSFAERLHRLYVKPLLLQEMSREAMRSTESFSADHMTSSYLRALERLRELPARRRPDPSFPPRPDCRSRYPRWLRKLKRRLVSLTRNSGPFSNAT
jgi:hypothetical protein